MNTTRKVLNDAESSDRWYVCKNGWGDYFALLWGHRPRHLQCFGGPYDTLTDAQSRIEELRNAS